MRASTFVKIVGIGLFVGCGDVPGAAVLQSDAPLLDRTRITINEGWRYAPGDIPGAAEVDFDDNTWEKVDLPHTWNDVDAFDKTPGYRRGTGWYRKYLEVPSTGRNRKQFIYFEGANQVADVFMNGVHVGRHVGGYTAFVVDVTDELSGKGPNVLAVRVDNRHDPDIPPLSADFTFYGGIYRDVWLLSTDNVHIDVMDHASPGIFVDTPQVTDTAATVRVRGKIVNETPKSRTVLVRSRILDGGNMIASFELELELAAGVAEPFEVTTPPIPDVKLWSPGSPNVYSVATEVFDGERLVDRVTIPLGFRWIGYSGEEGFSLNGKPLRLTGTNRHQDFQGYGSAVPNWVHRKDVEIIKDTGFNFLRLAHYPQDPVVLEETDRQGLVVWEEIPIVNMITLSDAFKENCETMLVEMIRQHYNHPSILMWGFMNEHMQFEPHPLPTGYYERLLTLARDLDNVVKKEDPYRATVMAQSLPEIYNGTGVSDVTDILGMNLYFGWYYGTFDSLATFLDRVHASHPDRPLIVSEYGAGSDERVHTLQPATFDFSPEYAQDFHRSAFKIIQDRPYLAASAVWNQFDFGSEGRQDTKNAINQKGLFLYDRTPKDVAFYYRAALGGEGTLHIANEWSSRAGSRASDAAQPVWIYSNAEEVELMVNGEPVSVKPTSNFRAEWTVQLRDGVNRVRALAPGASDVVLAEAVIEYDDRTRLFEGNDAQPGDVLAVNAGAHYQFVGRDRLVWEADRAYAPGNWGYEGGESRLVHNRIVGTDDDPLFQATRDGVDSYRFDVVDGAYEVEVLLCETSTGPKGKTFDVIVNNVPLWNAMNLSDSFGSFVAVRRSILVDAENGQGITVRFDPPSASTVSGLLIRRR